MSWERHVKTSPNTENSDNTISSLARGEEVTIIGKTAYGYLIYKAEDIVTEIPSVVVHFGWSIGAKPMNAEWSRPLFSAVPVLPQMG